MVKKIPTTEPSFDLNAIAREEQIRGEVARGILPESSLPEEQALNQRDLSKPSDTPYARAYRKTMLGIGPLSKNSKR